MGTNFYWRIEPQQLPNGTELSEVIDRDNPAIHIGKRSAAGRYCWDCEIPVSGPHCLECGATEGASAHNAAKVELGFAKTPRKRPRGVSGVARFTWAQDPNEVRRLCEEHMAEPVIEDEYQRPYTGADFLHELTFCPMWKYSLERWFC